MWLVASAALVGWLLASTADAPGAASAPFPTRAGTTDEPARIDRPVRIDEKLVRAEPVAAAQPREHVSAPIRRSVQRRYARDRAESVIARARRLFFGDGEAKPEPFPRPR